MSSTATQSSNTHRKSAAEVRNVAVSFVPKLAAGDLLTGTPTVTKISGDSSLVIGSAQRNSTTLIINGLECIADQAVAFKVSVGTAGQTYVLRVSCATVATETLEVDCTLAVDA